MQKDLGQITHSTQLSGLKIVSNQDSVTRDALKGSGKEAICYKGSVSWPVKLAAIVSSSATDT